MSSNPHARYSVSTRALNFSGQAIARTCRTGGDGTNIQERKDGEQCTLQRITSGSQTVNREQTMPAWHSRKTGVTACKIHSRPQVTRPGTQSRGTRHSRSFSVLPTHPTRERDLQMSVRQSTCITVPGAAQAAI